MKTIIYWLDPNLRYATQEADIMVLIMTFGTVMLSEMGGEPDVQREILPLSSCLVTCLSGLPACFFIPACLTKIIPLPTSSVLLPFWTALLVY